MSKKTSVIEALDLPKNGKLYTRVQGFLLFTLGLVGLRYFLPYVGINITVETVRFCLVMSFVVLGLMGSVSLFFSGLERVISGKVGE